jgi:hypothetical protein
MDSTRLASEDAPDQPAVKKGRLRQSVMGWCFNPMPAEQLARHAKAIGLVGIEGISTDHYPAVRELGLEISLVGSHGFQRGPFSRENHDSASAGCAKASTGPSPSSARTSSRSRACVSRGSATSRAPRTAWIAGNR